MRKDVGSLVEDVSQLVSLPEIYYQLEDALGQPHTSLDDLAAIIRTDADLTARLLAMSNSAFYAFPGKIESINRALSTIGTRQLRDLVLATTVVRLFSRLPFDSVSMSSFWQHSLYVGLISRGIARELGEPNTERYYVAALLHDIGRLVMFLKFPDLMHTLLKRSAGEERLLYELEREHIGYDHGDVGGALLTSWRLPKSLAEPVGLHHAPARAEEYPLETAVVHLADVLANRDPRGTSGDNWVPRLDAGAVARVGLESAVTDAIVSAAQADFEELRAMFEA